jgi:transposase
MDELGCSRRFISRWQNQEKQYHDQSRSGRPPALNRIQTRSIIKRAALKRRRSYLIVASQFSKQTSVTVSYKTVQRILKMEELKSYYRPLKPRLTLQHKQKRLAWAKENTNLEGANVVMVDEKHWKPYAPGNRKNDVVWAYTPEQVPALEVQEQGPEFHTVGAMSVDGVFPLVFYEGSLNAAKYQEILAKRVLPEAKDRFGDEGYELLHDKASSHTAKSTRHFLEEQLPDSCSFSEFPPHSPDLNLVDTLWAQVLYRVQGRNFKSMRGLKKIIREEWNNVEDETCQKLADGFQDRIRNADKARGAHTKH